MNQSDDKGAWSEKIEKERLEEGEINRLFETYLPKLISLTDRRIAKYLESKFDADDVAISVFRTVLRRIQKGEFKFQDDAEFWRLLITIAKRKISNKIRHFKTKSRSLDKEVAEVANAIIESPEPSPDDAAAFAESLKLLIDELGEKEKEILLLRMENYQFQEIADKVDVSERTVRRKMANIKERLIENFLDDSLEDDPNPAAE